MRRPLSPEQGMVRRLVSLAQDADARAVLESLAQLHVTASERENEIAETEAAVDLPRLRVVQVYKELDTIGCGRFIVGRRGHPSRFEWRFAPASVSAAALNKRYDLDPLASEGAGDEEVPAAEADERQEEFIAAPPAPDAQVIEHAFMLRPDFTVKLSLPVSLSKNEADRLAAFIRTLPFV